jgi:ribA/ribD-fused uncharacterized protein
MNFEPQIFHNDGTIITFSKAKEPFGSLGNMSGGYPIRLGDLTIVSSESLYQALRYPAYEDCQQEILDQKGGMGAKMVAKKYYSCTREDWDEVKVPLMEFCLRLKLTCNWEKQLGEDLVNSKGKTIVEYSKKDKFWGATPNGDYLYGANVLGQLWMKVRDDFILDIENDTTNFLKVTPPEISSISILGRVISSL